MKGKEAMIEVLFADSETAAMKVAKNTIMHGKTDGPTSVWFVGKKKPPQKSFAGWIPGTSREVIGLSFLLDVGDIRQEVNSDYRKKLICSLYAQEQWGRDAELERELREATDAYANELVRLQHYLEDGESIRIWYSDAPYSRCGFYMLCGLLQKYENDISVVKMPEYEIRGNTIQRYQSWGEVSAEEFAAFLPYEKKLSKQEIRMNAGFWSELQEENSPLRAVVNGQLVGVSESFYDFLIWKRLTDEPIKEARLIGNILGYYPLGIGDWWYAKRINHFISEGKIKVVEDSEKKYARMICLA